MNFKISNFLIFVYLHLQAYLWTAEANCTYPYITNGNGCDRTLINLNRPIHQELVGSVG